LSSLKISRSLLTIALSGAISVASAKSTDPVKSPQATGESQDNGQQTPSQQQAAELDATRELQRVEVTGSRLEQGDVTSRTIVLDQEEIKARGVTSVTELIRTLPQNVATIGDIANERSKGPMADSTNRNARISNIGTLGVSAANLGGVGAGKTLVLVNGRRIAGAAGIDEGYANLNGIPLSAVERVEINLDGASAVYGADAMGGVINFILKKNFVGNSLNVQHEYSSNDADNHRISLFSGYSWESGNVSLSIDKSKRKPINNWKSGYVTEDYSGYYNGDKYYDKRSFARGGQPGIIDTSYYQWDDATMTGYTVARGLTLPEGFTGAPTTEDFIEVDSSAMRDYVPELAGPGTDGKSVSLSFSQDISDRLSFTFNGIYNRNENEQQWTAANGVTLNLAPGQYYNPYPAYSFNSYSPGTTVYYYPEEEINSGVLPTGIVSNASTDWNINATLAYELTKKSKLEFTYTTSASKTEGESWNFGSIVSIVRDSSSPNGYSCYNFDLANNNYSGEELAFYQDLYNRQCQALTSSDPNLAVNPWNTNSGSGISDFFYKTQDESRSTRTQNFELRWTGSVLELPAGEISYALGGEFFEDGVSSNEVKVYTGEAVSRDRYAWFVESSIPIFGSDFTLPAVKSLTVSVAARRDNYKTEGAVGTVDGIPHDQGGVIVYGKNTFARTTPSFGFRWGLTDALSLRAKWSEGFKAPPYSNLFNVTGSSTYTTIIYDDPLYDCNPNCDYPYVENAYYAPMTTAPNPDLKPETSIKRTYSLSWMPQGVLSGLSLDIGYSHTKVENEYADHNDLKSLLPTQTIYTMEEFYPRDANGKISSMQSMIFNIMGSEYKSITYELGYMFQTRFGGFEPRLTYLDNLKSERRAFAGSEPVSTLGKLQGVDDYKIIGSLRWFLGNFNATLWAYYTPEYINDYEVSTYAGVVSNPDYAKTVDAYLTWDLTMSWQVRNNLRINFAGRNILDADPSFVVVETRPYDTARYNAAGRTLSLEMQYDF
jgi:iron complex outermembrane receptor protein